MDEIRQPGKVRFFAGIMYLEDELLNQALGDLENRFGEVCLKSPAFNFDFTDYYAEEMGNGLKKIFIGFTRQMDPEKLAEIKLFTNLLEERLGINVQGAFNRRVNVDPGYVDTGKVVLASTKNRSQRIYLKEGIYAEVTLLLKGKNCEPLSWTYPDYRTELACRFFLSLSSL
jgi:hypothetical protein